MLLMLCLGALHGSADVKGSLAVYVMLCCMGVGTAHVCVIVFMWCVLCCAVLCCAVLCCAGEWC
jgi:hypothetical protein